jgi:hypothetical protein
MHSTKAMRNAESCILNGRKPEKGLTIKEPRLVISEVKEWNHHEIHITIFCVFVLDGSLFPHGFRYPANGAGAGKKRAGLVRRR